MRPIYWGVIWFFIGMIGWIGFSVIEGFGAAFGETDPFLMALVYIFGFLFFFSLPIAVVAEIVRWVKGKKTHKNTN